MDNATRHCLSSYLNEITERYNAEKARLDQLDSYLTQKLKTRREVLIIYRMLVTLSWKALVSAESKRGMGNGY
jgi:thiamine kinase-like enzyme